MVYFLRFLTGIFSKWLLWDYSDPSSADSAYCGLSFWEGDSKIYVTRARGSELKSNLDIDSLTSELFNLFI